MTRPLLHQYAECNECCNPILFVQLDTGKRIPVDPMPNTRGNVAAMRIGNNLHGYVVQRGVLTISDRYTLHMPHAATCPERPGPAAPKTSPDSPLF